MPQDILIIEDERDHLESLRLHVRTNLGIEPFTAEDASHALQIVSFYPIKVIITDWLLPGKNGIELYNEIKDKTRNYPPIAILLSGYKDQISLQSAINAGFLRFIDKLEVQSQLTSAIRDAMMHYETKHLSKSVFDLNVKLLESKRFYTLRPKFWNPNVTILLERITNITDTFVRETDWNTDYIAERGIAKKLGITIERSARAYQEIGSQSEVICKAGYNLATVIATIESQLNTKIISWIKETHEREIKLQVRCTLDIKEISELYSKEKMTLQSREYQSAAVYAIVNCTLKLECSCCKIPRFFEISLFLPTGKVTLRQVEHYDGGPDKIIYNGFQRAIRI